MTGKSSKTNASDHEQQRLLAAIADARKKHRDVGGFIEELARLLMRHIADFIAIDIIEDDGAVSSLLLRHSSLRAEAQLSNFRTQHPLKPTSSYGYPRVIKTGKAQLIRGVTPRVVSKLFPGLELDALSDGAAIRSFLCVPLVHNGRTIGTLTLMQTGQSKAFSTETLTAIEPVCDLLAAELDRRLSHNNS